VGRVGWGTAVGLVDSGRRTSWTGRGDGAAGRAAAAGAGDPAVDAAPDGAAADSWLSSGATAPACPGVGRFAAGRTAGGRAAPDAAGLAGRGRTEGGLTISAGRLGGRTGAEAAWVGAGAGRAGAAATAGGEAAKGLEGGAGGSVPEDAPVSWLAFFTARMALGAGVGAAPPPLLLVLLLVRISARIRPASSSLMELLWLRAGMDRVSAASSTSLLSRPRSLDNS